MEPAEGNVWFYIRDHNQQGPIGFFGLKKMFEKKILSSETFIWTKDLPCWQMAKTLDLFSDFTVETHPQNYSSEWEDLKKDKFPNGRSVVRYLARFFDLSIFSLFLITLISIFSHKFKLTLLACMYLC